MSELFRTLETTVRAQKNRYYGKYRAIVADVEDPQNLGRLKLSIPSVLGQETSDWALPVTPYGGGDQFGFLAVPPKGAQVVAEFLEGDISAPVWTGSFWRQPSEVPEEFSGEGGQSVKILKTEAGHVLKFQDKEDEERITLLSAAGAEAVLDENGSLTLTDGGGATVTLDAEAGELLVEDANGNSLKFTSSGVACTDANGNEITTSGGGVEIKSSATVNVEGASVSIAGAGGEPLIKGSTFLSLFNSHTHPTAAPGAPTAPPMVPLTPSVLTTKSTAS